MSARADVLDRIRSALGPGVAVPEVPREYRRAGEVGGDIVSLFCSRAAEYKATVRRLAADELQGVVRELCGGKRIAVPPGGPDVLSGVEVVVDDPPLSPQALDGLDGVLTGCALAMKTVAGVFGSRPRYERAQKLARLGRGPVAKAALPGWTTMRELPDPPKQTFRDWWRERPR